jgi:CBS domain-containing protein
MVARVPVLRHETLEPSGSRKGILRVFCPAQGRSMLLARCADCPQLCKGCADGDAPDASILCSIHPPAPRSAPSPTSTTAELAAGALVGEAMGGHVVCVSVDVPVRLVQNAIAIEGAFALPVISEQGECLGIVQRKGVESFPAVMLPILDAGVVETNVSVLEESAPLLDAIVAMTTKRARWLPVVNAVGHVVGAISDIDLLRWVGRASRG